MFWGGWAYSWEDPWRCFQKWFPALGGQGGCLDWDWAVRLEWGLMKTNDLTRSKGWDQGWRILRPSQFPTWEINEGREQSFLCIIYSLRLLSPIARMCSPPVDLLRPYDTAPKGHSWLDPVHGKNRSILWHHGLTRRLQQSHVSCLFVFLLLTYTGTR